MASRPVIDTRKIADYCLSDQHDDGKHKARLFREILAITQENAQLLIDALTKAAADVEAEEGKGDCYGQRWVIDFEMQRPAGTATVRSAWMVLAGESVPRLVTCYIL